MRRAAEGKTLRTVNPPMSRGRASTTARTGDSAMDSEHVGSCAGWMLMMTPYLHDQPRQTRFIQEQDAHPLKHSLRNPILTNFMFDCRALSHQF